MSQSGENLAVEGSESPGIDVQELMSRCLGNLQFAQRVVAKFQARLDEDMAELERSAQCNDTEGIARIAHRIKGASANVAAPGLCTRAAALEEMALLECVSLAAAVLAELRQEQSRFSQAAADLGASSTSCF